MPEDAQLRVQAHLLHNFELLVELDVLAAEAKDSLEALLTFTLSKHTLSVLLSNHALLVRLDLFALALSVDLSKHSSLLSFGLGLGRVDQSLGTDLSCLKLRLCFDALDLSLGPLVNFVDTLLPLSLDDFELSIHD